MNPLGNVQLAVVYYEVVRSWTAPSVAGNCGDLCIVHNILVGKVRLYFHDDTEWISLPRDQIFDASWKEILLEGEGGGSFGELDGGAPDSDYGGIENIDAGGP